MPTFSQLQQSTNNNSRTGVIAFEDERLLETPYLFPVSFLVTGTTARGGATWKHILHEDNLNHGQCLLRRDLPILSQVLHFLDYKVSPGNIQSVWRQETIRGLYNKQIDNLNYQAPLFLDSGGFKLMWRTGLDLTAYGISLNAGEEAKSILALQKDFGGDLVATLDYPLPPNLDPSEAQQRMKRSRDNAIQAAELLQTDSDFAKYNPMLYMAVHGLTVEAIGEYITKLFQELREKELDQKSFGLAIGSLVPLRSAHKTKRVIDLVRTVITTIPEEYRQRVPVHVFGSTGLMIPFLAYCGIDTFDSSTFAQEARALRYLSPTTYYRHHVLEMERVSLAKCDCPICQHLSSNDNLREMQDSLVSDVKGVRLPSGRFKSAYYADIALHNLHLDFEIVSRTRLAIESDNLDDYLIEMSRKIPRTAEMLWAIAASDERLKKKATKASIPVPQKRKVAEPVITYKSLAYTPYDFNINANGYYPEKQKPILLIIPCSSTKPYGDSFSHSYLFEAIEEELVTWQEYIDKVTLSGLYGPVPFAKENEHAVLHYDFRLSTSNEAQMALCVERLSEFLQKHGHCYQHCIAYGTMGAYRRVFEKTAKQNKCLEVLPRNLKARTSKAYFDKRNVAQLTTYLQTIVKRKS